MKLALNFDWKHNNQSIYLCVMLRIAYDPIYVLPLPEGHRFPMAKYELLPEQLVYEGTITEDQLFKPELLSEEILLLTHTSEYWAKLRDLTLSEKEARKIGFPLSEQMITRTRVISKGTVMATEFAAQYGVAMNIAGGTHHSYPDHGEGFCILNDMAVASNNWLQKNPKHKILIVDLDVHQGNGTAVIFQDDDRVFTFSMHGEKNYPLRKERSSLDIGLEDGTDDKTYLNILRYKLPQIIDQVKPDLIFFQSGVDVLATDKLGRLGLTLGGCKERDQIVMKYAKLNAIPLVISMGGGYSHSLHTIVEAHANTFRSAQEIFF